MNIVKHPDPRLRQVCSAFTQDEIMAIQTGQQVSDGAHELPSLAIATIGEQMLKTCAAAGGIGLAGPQVGIMRRIIAVSLSGVRQVILNPEIASSHGKQGGHEGCLSYPGRRVYVERAKMIRVQGLDTLGRPIAMKASNLLATVIQHEIDHLNGVCRVGPMLIGGTK